MLGDQDKVLQMLMSAKSGLGDAQRQVAPPESDMAQLLAGQEAMGAQSPTNNPAPLPPVEAPNPTGVDAKMMQNAAQNRLGMGVPQLNQPQEDPQKKFARSLFGGGR